MLVRSSFAVLAAACALVSSSAQAHVSVSGPGYANQSQVLNFGVGHGCAGADTVRIEVSLPKEVSQVRAVPSGVFGEMSIRADAAGVPTAVVWTKPNARAADDSYYTLSIRLKLPDAPFTTLYFPTKQVCRDKDGNESTTDWVALPGAEVKEGEEEEPAPALNILPARFPGWNKVTAKADVKDLKVFDDAQIVWVGDAAYSSNPATKELIKSEDGVKELTEIKANAEIWVKY